MKKYALLGLLITAFSAHADTGLKNGNNVSSVYIQGEIAVQCQVNPGTTTPGNAMFRCEDDILLPSEYDYFVGPQRIQSDQVTLVATHDDGSTRTKTVGYDSAKGQSTEQINLWISTLLQRPLLNPGNNTIDYTITYKDKITGRGQFKVTVKDGGTKTCKRTGFFWSINPSDCQNGGSLCDQYFRDNNYCL